MYRVLCSVIFVLLMVPQSEFLLAESSDDITVLETLIVTDSVKNTRLLDTPGSITVLNVRDIRNSGQTRLAELIASIPGVVNQKAGAKTYFSIRGTRGSLSPGAAIYVDGRPINTGLYRYSKVDTIPLDNVEKIEVIKSPSPAIYGANASRGVILITTCSGKNTEKPVEAILSGEYGSWGSAKGTVMLSGAQKNAYYSLTGHEMQADGYRGSDEEVSSIDGKLGYRFDGGFIDMVAGHNDSFTKYPAGLDLAMAERDPESEGYYHTKGYFVLPNQTDEELSNVGLKFNYDKKNWLLNASMNYTNDKQCYQQFKDFNSTKYRQDDYRDEREEDRFDVKIGGGKTFGTKDSTVFDTITLSADYLHSEFDQKRDCPFASDPWTSKMTTAKKKADIELTYRIYAVNANNDFTLKKFRLLTGARLNYVKYELNNREPASVEKDYDADLDWSISPSYQVTANSNLFVSFNHSNWYLPFGHFKSDMEYDHPDAQAENLEPETYDTWEMGFKHRLNKAFNYSIILYHTEIEEKIVSFYEGNNFRGYRNAGTSTHQGLELEVDGRPWDWFGYRLNFTTIDAEWDSGLAKAYLTPSDTKTSIMDLSGNDVHYVPEYEYTISFDFFLLQSTPWGSLTTSVDVRGFGEQYEDYNNNFKMSAANFIDMKITWSFGRYELYLNGTNLFDRQWWKYVNSTGKNHNKLGGMSGIYPQDGRYIGIGGAVRF